MCPTKRPFLAELALDKLFRKCPASVPQVSRKVLLLIGIDPREAVPQSVRQLSRKAAFFGGIDPGEGVPQVSHKVVPFRWD